MAEAPAAVSQRRGINPIWLVPIVALALGIWMMIYTLQSQGPEITISFLTAEGLEAGKTKIKLRNVDVGMVEGVRLGDDLESVVVTASLEKEATPLLRDDTQFWVVRPRIGKAGVSGLGTLLSGAYIQLAPGEGVPGKRRFTGLEEPPVTPAGTPGVRVRLTATRAGSVSAGDPVLYKGYSVGRVETEMLDTDAQLMRYEVFIDAPFDELLSMSHRFWDTSGLSIRAGADGVEFDSVALETLLFGGVEVGLPEGVSRGRPVEADATFKLYSSYADVKQRPYRHSIAYVVRFLQSVRGLAPGAPVEYRGIRIGEVQRVMVTELGQSAEGGGQPIPILIHLEPARLELEDSLEGSENMRTIVETAVAGGLRATLSTGNLLTGSLFVSFDFYPDAERAEMGTFADLRTIPTIESGLAGIEQRLTTFLDKLNDLPLEGAVAEAQQTLASIDRLVGGEGMQELPATLDATLVELRGALASVSSDSELQVRLLPLISELDRTLASLRGVLDTLNEQPNALIFNRAYREDPRPPAGSQ